MKQLTEDYVSFETAKLLKEKGFDEYCNNYYYFFENNSNYWDFSNKGYEVRTKINKNSDKLGISCPTHQMALKWLREVHGLHIEIGYIKNHYGNLNCGYFFSIVGINSDYKYCQSCLDDIFEEPEQAVEAALKYTLENLI
ncbi:MAG: hypothetical protein J6X18_00500 [Bacteroidales bacterium]|nr:hypothetical protein [Bacteroidales bacterium]